MTRVAAIDCGTNSIRLLVADVDAERGEFRDLDRRMDIVRLGQGVDRTGRLAPDALARTFAACETYAGRIAELGAERVRFVATSASRDARNREEFVAGVVDRIGVEPEVVSGAEEAALSFSGATRELLGRTPGPFLVVDVGGGSTEFVLGERSVLASVSVDVGCVRLTERHLHDDPPTFEQVAAARADADAAVRGAALSVPFEVARTVVGVAGTVTTLAGIHLGLPAYQPELIHRSVLPATVVHDLTGLLLTMTHAERAALPVMHPGRVDVIGGGAIVVDAVLREVGAEELVVSEHDILDGIAWSIA
ncbi:MAG TPA: Ppx/GppA phosphatase family protein [Actinomycetes bacterium]|nr:Ppx/GppA phosphatase family protein [Actinomycetes bacterium]